MFELAESLIGIPFPPLSVFVNVFNWGFIIKLLFIWGFKSCLPNVVEAVDEEELEEEELLAVMDFPIRLVPEESLEFELDVVEPLLGIIILMLSTSCVE